MSRRESEIKRRAELKAFMKSDLDELIAKMERQEIHRMQAREIHWKVLSSRISSNVVDIRGK
jgi:hypothetical protein